MPNITKHSSSNKQSATNVIPTTSSPSSQDLNAILREAQIAPNDDDEPTPKRQQFIKITQEQFTQLLNAYTAQQTTINCLTIQSHTVITPPNTTTNATPAYYTNTKYEEISCKPIKPSYHGTPDALIPFLNKLDLRHQSEGWADATFITIDDTKFDITTHFTKVPEDKVIAQAKTHCSSITVSADKHTIGHMTFNSRLLSIVLFNSITDAVFTSILHRVPQDLCNDGTLILWTICNNVYQNNITFTETIRDKIRLATLKDHNNDIKKYLFYIKDNLGMLHGDTHASTADNGLLTYMFQQLKRCYISFFRDFMRKQHVNF